MTKQNIEEYLKDITNPDNTGLPAIIAMTKLKRAIGKGAVISGEYAHVNDIFLTQKRADCLQAMGVDAWEKSNDSSRGVSERLELLKAIEGYKDKGDFGWQVFGITERDFYWQKTVLEVNEFYEGLDNQADYYASVFDERFGDYRLRQKFERDTMMSEEDINTIVRMCSEIKDKKYANMKTAHLAKFDELSAKVDDETLPFEERIEALLQAERQIGYFHRTASDVEKQKSRDMDTKRDELFYARFKSEYKEALAHENALQSFKALEKLEEDARNEGFELDEVLGIDWPEFYRKQERFLFDAADELIKKTDEMVSDGNPIEAYHEFNEYFSSMRMNALEDAGHDTTEIIDHIHKLLKIKTKFEFDRALGHSDAFIKANQLGAFAPGGYMSGHALDELFGKDKADEMRDVAKNAFITITKEALANYEAEGNEEELWRADSLRADKFLEWSDITDDVEALKARVERNGHELRM